MTFRFFRPSIPLWPKSPNKYNILAYSGTDHPTDKDFVDGDFITYKGMTFYFDGEGIFTNGTNEGVGDGINDLDNLKIPFKDVFTIRFKFLLRFILKVPFKVSLNLFLFPFSISV